MSLRSYDKKGALPYWAKKHATLDEALNKIAEGDPEFAKNFKAPASKEEFEKMYDKYVNNTVDAEVISVITETKEKKATSNTSTQSDNTKPKGDDFYTNDEIASDKFGFDDLSSQQPKIRDYVNDKGLSASGPTNENTPPAQTTFEEPQSWGDAFTIPADNEQTIFDEEGGSGGEKGGGNNTGGQKSGGSSGGSSGPKREKQPPLNPGFDDMDRGRARREAQKMAKIFVTVFCLITETGFVYFVTREISTERLAELEAAGEIDLDITLDLGNENFVIARNFFINKKYEAQELAKISNEEKGDLIAALTELLMERGVAPTPLQKVLLNMGVIAVRLSLEGFKEIMSNRAVLNVTRVEGTPTARAAHTHIPPDQNAEVVNETKSNTVTETLGNLAKNMAETFAGSGGENLVSEQELDNEIAASNMDLGGNTTTQQQGEDSPFSAGQSLGF